MSNKPAYLTQEGLDKLKAELDELVHVKRDALAVRLSFAIKQGDLSENADYIQAKEEQAFLEGRILDVQAIIRNAQVIQANTEADGTVRMGGHVTVAEDGYDDEETYHIVGATEADPSNGKISYESPLGQALIGKRKGDKVKVQAPAGEITFKILKVE